MAGTEPVPGVDPYRGNYYLWSYKPSLVAAIIFLILFFIITLLHMVRMIKLRLWFMIPFTLGGIFQIIGYTARSISHTSTGTLMPYVTQSTFILVSPALYAASIYMTLSRLVLLLNGTSYSLVSPRWMTRIFVIGDIFSFAVQSGGAGFLASGNNASMGENIIVGGLFIQISIFGFFVATAGVFHWRFGRHSPVAAAWEASLASGNRGSGSSRNGMRGGEGSGSGPVNWKKMLWVLYGVSAMIMVRSVFRVIEYMGGEDGYLLSHEWTLYVFDAALMWAVMVIFYIWYPRDVKVEKGSADQSFEELGMSDNMEETRSRR